MEIQDDLKKVIDINKHNRNQLIVNTNKTINRKASDLNYLPKINKAKSYVKLNQTLASTPSSLSLLQEMNNHLKVQTIQKQPNRYIDARSIISYQDELIRHRLYQSTLQDTNVLVVLQEIAKVNLKQKIIGKISAKAEQLKKLSMKK